jgi:hypothetical protein
MASAPLRWKRPPDPDRIFSTPLFHNQRGSEQASSEPRTIIVSKKWHSHVFEGMRSAVAHYDSLRAALRAVARLRRACEIWDFFDNLG